jgi:hypothetical protein
MRRVHVEAAVEDGHGNGRPTARVPEDMPVKSSDDCAPREAHAPQLLQGAAEHPEQHLSVEIGEAHVPSPPPPSQPWMGTTSPVRPGAAPSRGRSRQPDRDVSRDARPYFVRYRARDEALVQAKAWGARLVILPQRLCQGALAPRASCHRRWESPSCPEDTRQELPLPTTDQGLQPIRVQAVCLDGSCREDTPGRHRGGKTRCLLQGVLEPRHRPEAPRHPFAELRIVLGADVLRPRAVAPVQAQSSGRETVGPWRQRQRKNGAQPRSVAVASKASAHFQRCTGAAVKAEAVAFPSCCKAIVKDFLHVL